ncbi:MAG: hypothetical protein RBU35_20570, partial [Anaerolineae bacterium]|nr:hypothetical protein [Anaerolineae bacterium]
MDAKCKSAGRPGALAVLLALCLLLPAGLAPGDAGAAFTAAQPSSTVLITAVYYDTYLSGEPDEAFRLANVQTQAMALSSWTISDG